MLPPSALPHLSMPRLANPRASKPSRPAANSNWGRRPAQPRRSAFLGEPAQGDTLGFARRFSYSSGPELYHPAMANTKIRFPTAR